jgi:DinB superfamily
MADKYSAENSLERERLVKLVSGLGEAQLMRPMPNGWSVASKLLHLAFWDQYCLALLRAWRRNGVSVSTIDVDAVNAAVRALSEGILPAAVGPLVRAAAETVDREAAAITPELRTAIEAAGRARVLHRAVHRREHLDQIERALRT